MNGSSLSPSRTVVTSFTPRKPSLSSDGGTTAFEEGDWVLCAAASSPHQQQAAGGNSTNNDGTVSCALSNGQVQVYDQARLHRIHSFETSSSDNNTAPLSIVNDLVYGPQHTLVACCNTGTVNIWDLRQASPAVTASIPAGQDALSISMGFDGYLAAVASSKAKIHFIDLRQSASLLGTYADAHTQQVTQVRFQPWTCTLLSAAEDGLACIFDTTQPTEEEALKSILTVGTPLRHVGFCGVDMATVYCLTGSETASLWNWDSATCQQDFGGHSLRQRLGQSVGHQLDYLVDIHWDAVSQELMLLAGSATGEAALFRAAGGSNGSGSVDFEPCNVLTSGHRGVVRAWCPLSSSTLITAGEDARLCEWNRLDPHGASIPVPVPATTNKFLGRNEAPTTTGADDPLRPQKRHKQSSAPY